MYKNKTAPPQTTVKLITTFSNHHLDVRTLLGNHWHLLQDDPILGKYVGNKPEIIFRRAASLRDKLTTSHYMETNDDLPQLPLGTSKCGSCSFCPWVTTSRTVSLSNGDKFAPKFSANCRTEGVIYLMTCQCGAFYMGKTSRQLRQRINGHIYYSGNGKMLTSVSRHLDLYHKCDTLVVSFLVLAVVPRNPKGGEWDKILPQKEAIWVERLSVVNPPGLNETQS